MRTRDEMVDALVTCHMMENASVPRITGAVMLLLEFIAEQGREIETLKAQVDQMDDIIRGNAS